jgi:hypothetical protein
MVEAFNRSMRYEREKLKVITIHLRVYKKTYLLISLSWPPDISTPINPPLYATYTIFPAPNLTSAVGTIPYSALTIGPVWA